MASTVRHVGFADPEIGFPPLERRSIAVNTANLQLAVGDEAAGLSAGQPLPLLAIRYFADTAQYVVDDFVIWEGQIWRAKVTVPPGPFSPSDWVGMTDGGQFLLLDGTREMYGNLEIDKPGASLVLNAIGASQADIWFRRDGLTRWLFRSDETEAVDFHLARFDDAGFIIDRPLTVSRSTGRLSVLSDPTLPLELAPKQYVDAHISEVVEDLVDFVKISGDTMTGGLIAPALTINNPTYADLHYVNGSSERWLIRGADGATSNFEFHHYDDAGAYLGAALVLNRANGDATFQRNVTAGGAVYTPGMQFGGGAATGFYGDGTNIALRTYGNNTIYLQNAGGTLTYATFGSGGANIYGNATVTGALTAPTITATSSDGLRISVPGGNNARVYSTVAGVRSWTTGTASDGRYFIADESVASVRFIINLDGSIEMANNLSVPGTLTAGTLVTTNFTVPGSLNTGSLEGVYYVDFKHPGDNWDYSARIITENNSPPSGGQSHLGIICGKLHINALVNSDVGYECRAPTTGGTLGNYFNFFLLGGYMHAYIDTTYVGIVSLVSDYRIKKDVVDLTSKWATVKGLRPVSYTHKTYSPAGHTRATPFVEDDGTQRWGFIAHELQEALLPSAATATKDDPQALQSPNEWPVLAALTKALQEAMTRIEELEERVTELEGIA